MSSPRDRSDVADAEMEAAGPGPDRKEAAGLPCPFAVRIFISRKDDKRIRPDLLADPDALPEDELNVYCWSTTTLRELADQVKVQAPALANHAGARIAFSAAIPTSSGAYKLERMGTVHEFRNGKDDNKTLTQVGFEIGDYVCATIA